MHRRDFLLLAASTAAAQRVDYRDYSRSLPDYLRALAAQAYDTRNRALAAINTPALVRERRQWARRTFWQLTGGEPERTPLNPRVTGELDRPAYRIRKVVYESWPGMHVPANLYIPKGGRAPYPGVLFQMGHSLNGKASPLYQYCCQGLAQLGFVVLAFDPMGQGERTYYPAANGLTRLGSADDEHTLPGKQLLLTGDTSTRLQTWDAVRSLDYLASLDFVDPARLASTGNSGGGTLTMLLAAVDDRLACAAPACPNTENHACANFNSPGSTDDAEQNFINGGTAGFDRWDTLWPFAPKPLLILVSAKDSYGTYSPRYIENGREEFAKLARAYELSGKRNQLDWYESPLPHGLDYGMRMRIYNWFRKWLQPGEAEVREEPPVSAEKDENLLCSPQASMVRAYDSKTPQQMAAARARNITTPDKPADLPRLLAIDRAGAQPARKLGSIRSRRSEVEAWEVSPVRDVWIPYFLFRPTARDNGACIVLLEPAGRNAAWGEDSISQQLAALGFTVCAPDLRGIGDTLPEFPRHAARHGRSHQEEEHYSWASLMLGRPLLGQRVADLLSISDAFAGKRIIFAASGRMTVPATFTAAISNSIAKVAVFNGLDSFRELVHQENWNYPFANFLPEMLRYTDLPQLAASLGTRYSRLSSWNAESLSQL